MKAKIKIFLENKIVDSFLIILIILNFILFIFQTDSNFYDHFQKYINNFESLSILIFTIEYFLRILTIDKFQDIFKPMMLIDFFAVFPCYLSFVNINTVFLRIIRISRLFRIAKLARYTDAFKKIKKSFAKRKDELIVTILIFFIGLTFSSILIYFAEHNSGNQIFESIPSSFWWSVITCTSVGYGDAYPVTTLGKIIGSLTAIMGVGLHALLIGVIGAAFIDITKEEA